MNALVASCDNTNAKCRRLAQLFLRLCQSLTTACRPIRFKEYGASLVVLSLMLAVNPPKANAKFVVITVTGTVMYGSDASYFRPFPIIPNNILLTGLPFSLTIVIDDTRVVQSPLACQTSGCNEGGSDSNTGSFTATMQVGPYTATLVDKNAAGTAAYSEFLNIFRVGKNASDANYIDINFGSITGLYGYVYCDIQANPLAGAILTADYNWEDSLAASGFGPGGSGSNTCELTRSIDPPFVQGESNLYLTIETYTQTSAVAVNPLAKSLGDCGCGYPTSGGQLGVGDPVAVGVGNIYEKIIDYHSQGSNSFEFARYYNSMANSAGVGTAATELGENWRSTYDRYLSMTSDAVIAERPDGRQLVFSQTGAGWRSDSDIDMALAQSGSNWTLTDPQDTVETYSSMSGSMLLSQIQERNGYTQDLSYDSSNRLASVVDSYGRSFSFSYANGMLQSVSTPDKPVITYAFTPNSSGQQLTSVSYNTTPATSQSYLYENTAFPFALTGILDEDGNRYATWEYDAVGRGISSQHSTNADMTTVSYSTDGGATSCNSFGVCDTYVFSHLQGVPKVTSIIRASTPTTASAGESFMYDTNGYLSSRIDWNGNQTTYVNNSHGLPTSITEAVGATTARTTTIVYDSTWVHLPASVTTNGVTTSYTYDANGEVLTKTLTDTTTTTAPYSTAGQARTWTNTWSNALLASTQNPNGNTTQFGYDSSGALTSITDPLSHVTKITSHTGGGYPLTIVDPNTVTTTLTYDPRMRRTGSTVSGTGGTFQTTWAYDAAGNLTQTTLPDGSFIANTYDAAHRLTKVTDALGNYTAFTLDALGDRTQTSTYTSGGTLKKQDNADFDALGRMISDTAGAGQVTTRSFDANGNVLTVEDGLGRTTTNSYDALNRLSGSTDSNGGATTPAYDAHDRVISVADANRNSTIYIRDGFGDVIQQSSPDSGITVFHYDSDANLTSKTDALGIVTNQTFDALDRPLTTTYPAHTTENVAYTYDQTGTGFSFGIGRLTSVTDAAGSLTRTYDERGNLANETRVNGTTNLTTAYTYDGANRIASMTYPDGTLVTYSHDAAGYTSTVTAKLTGSSTTTTLATLTHQPFGPQSGVTYGNGIAETWTYDKAYRPTNITDLLSGNGVQNLSYAYDKADNVGSITDALNPANSQTLGYDPLNRLVSAATGSGGYGSYSWTYDKVGNRLTQIAGSTVTTYGYASGSNRLATITTNTAIAQLRGFPELPLQHRPSSTQLASAPHTPHIGRNQVRIQRQPDSFRVAILGWPMVLAGFGGIVLFRKRLRSNGPLTALLLIAILTGNVILLNGCVASSHVTAMPTPAKSLSVKGMVHGGQQPVSGATIQLYAVGTTGDASAARPLVSTTVQSDQSGDFTLDNLYTCPSQTALVYLVATGGNPGLAQATNNAAIAMMAALGQCGSLSTATFVSVNEVTTVGSLAALYPYMSSYATLGSGTSDASALSAAFTAVSEFTNTTTGTVPGPALPPGYYASSVEINTLGNIVATCINSTGGTAGDGSACGNLFSLATPEEGIAPTDTIGAVLDILNNPSDNVADLYILSAPTAPFQPTVSAAPTSWNLPIVAIPATPTFLPAPGTYTSGGYVELDNPTAGVTMYYTTDGSTPTTNSTKYTGAISVSSTETIQAIATASGNTSSAVGSGTYTITGAGGNPTSNVVTVLTNANGNITNIPPADSTAYATFAYNNANRLASVTGSPVAATFVYDYAGQRYSKTNGGTPATVYSYMQGGTLITENDNGVVADYVYADGRPIAVIQPTATPAASQISYVVTDRLGTPQITVNGSGASTWNSTYQTFGTTDSVTASITQNLRFPGQLADAETGFSYNLNRDYMPNLGRYLETDLIGLAGGANSYIYVGANPVSGYDPSGLKCVGGEGCWTTPEERNILNSGDYLGYYRAACVGGDAYACFAQHIAANDNLWGNLATNRLLSALELQANAAEQCIDESADLSQIRTDLANYYANYLPSSENQAYWPVAADVAQFHWEEFAKFGLPPSTFGGTPFGPAVGPVFPGIWCPNCQ